MCFEFWYCSDSDLNTLLNNFVWECLSSTRVYGMCILMLPEGCGCSLYPIDVPLCLWRSVSSTSCRMRAGAANGTSRSKKKEEKYHEAHNQLSPASPHLPNIAYYSRVIIQQTSLWGRKMYVFNTEEAPHVWTLGKGGGGLEIGHILAPFSPQNTHIHTNHLYSPRSKFTSTHVNEPSNYLGSIHNC